MTHVDVGFGHANTMYETVGPDQLRCRRTSVDSNSIPRTTIELETEASQEIWSSCAQSCLQVSWLSSESDGSSWSITENTGGIGAVGSCKPSFVDAGRHSLQN